MHSSFLRGHDFVLRVGQTAVSHQQWFQGFKNTERLGLVAPNGYEGVGAVNLVMAYVTAFYDTYRAAGGDFFAYPDFYSFQNCEPVAKYSKLDIWPEHKNVAVVGGAVAMLDAINDRAITVLLVPDREPTNPTYFKAQLESARRMIGRCFAYSFAGQVDGADLVIETANRSLVEWADAVFELPAAADDAAWQAHWAAWRARVAEAPCLVQSYRSLTFEEALALL